MVRDRRRLVPKGWLHLCLGALGTVLLIGCQPGVETVLKKRTDGKPHEEYQAYVRGGKEIKHGYFLTYSAEGTLVAWRNYVNDEVHGHVVYFRPDGGVDFVECYDHGVLLGEASAETARKLVLGFR